MLDHPVYHGVFDSEYLEANLGISIDTGRFCWGFEIKDECDEPQDEYTRYFTGEIFLQNEFGDEEDQIRIGDMGFHVHLLSDFRNEYDEPAFWVIDDIDEDQSYCASYLEEKLDIPLDTLDVTVYLESIKLNPEYENRGIEKFIIDHMDRIVWLSTFRRPDILFGLATGKEEKSFAIASGDGYVTTEHGFDEEALLVWMKRFNKE